MDTLFRVFERAANGVVELATAERLQHDVGNTPITVCFREGRSGEPGYDDDRNIGSDRLRPFGEVGADQFRHRMVGHYDVEAVGRRTEGVQGLEALGKGAYFIADGHKQLARQIDDGFLVVDKHHMFVAASNGRIR